jgi:hypothetical protein
MTNASRLVRHNRELKGGGSPVFLVTATQSESSIPAELEVGGSWS